MDFRKTAGSNALITICIVPGGRLAFICERLSVYLIRGVIDVFSILEYDYEYKAKIMFKSGIISDMDFEYMPIDFKHIDVCGEIVSEFIIETRLNNGFLRLFSDDNSLRINLVIHSEIVQRIDDVTFSDKYTHGIKIKYKNGGIVDYKIKHESGRTYLVNEFEKLYISQSVDAPDYPVYCQDGIMSEIPIKNIAYANFTVSIETTSGDIYEFIRPELQANLSGRLYAGHGRALFVFDSYIHVFESEFHVILFDHHTKFLELEAPKKDYHLKINISNLNNYHSLMYYVDENCDVFKFNINVNQIINKCDGEYYNPKNEIMARMPNKFIIPNCFAIEVQYITKYENNFELNGQLLLLGPIAEYLDSLTLFGGFDPFIMMATIRGNPMRCSLIDTMGELIILFEEGTRFNVLADEGEYFSRHGKYELVPPSCYKAVKNKLYLIKDNLVLFNMYGTLVVSEIYESFGDYMCVDSSGKKIIGKISINARTSKSKPALRNED